MPQRPRSHRLEDISIRRFEDALPETWVPRKRTHDYGIDLEIEIFSDNDRSTGDIFYAQLRATDDLSKRTKLTLDVDQLEYFRSLELPTIIVRYNSSDESLYFKWHFDVDLPATAQKSLTVTFTEDDLWTTATPSQVLTTLRAGKALRAFPAGRPLSVLVGQQLESISQSYEFSRAWERLLKATPVVKKSEGGEPAELVITALPDGILIRIDRISSIRVDHDYESADQIFAVILYSIIFITHQVGLNGQSSQLAELALSLGIKATARPLAAQACAALVSRPLDAASLANLNDLAGQQDEFLVGLVAGLHRSNAPKILRLKATQNLYEHALAQGYYDGDALAKAAINYSLGNVRRSLGDYRGAIQAYVRAKRLRPEYQGSPYFCGELAGCLFLARRYAMAAKLYGKVNDGRPSQTTSLLLGDALLLAGSPGKAVTQFRAAEGSDIFPISVEAGVKAELCDWLIKNFGEGFRRHFSQVADQIAAAEKQGSLPGDWQALLNECDPLDPLSNFNAAKDRYDVGDLVGAYFRYLIVALSQPGDAEAWHNAIVCVMRDNTPRFISTLSLALWQCGREPYDLLRRKITDTNPEDPLLAALDSLADELAAKGNHDRFESLTVRLFRDDAFDAVFEVPSPSA